MHRSSLPHRGAGGGFHLGLDGVPVYSASLVDSAEKAIHPRPAPLSPRALLLQPAAVKSSTRRHSACMMPHD